MLYYLFTYLNRLFDFPGAGLFQYISFRAGVAFIFSLVLAAVYGKRVIRFLQKKQIGETIRDLGLEGQYQKKGTPTMGGLIIIGAIIIPTLLLARLENIYVILMLITTIWLGFIGFVDDYIKIFKKNKKGLKGRFKVLGQVTLGIIVSAVLCLSDDVVVREQVPIEEQITQDEIIGLSTDKSIDKIGVTLGKRTIKTEQIPLKDTLTRQELVDEINHEKPQLYANVDHKSTTTTIPFLKNNEFDYALLIGFLGEKAQKWAWLVFALAVIIIITAVSNGANITDGLDGLATGTSAVIGTTLGVFAYVSGNMIFADYLNIMYIPHTGELVVFASAFIGATVGFLWYNAFPAQVFMGDTGSLTLGGIIAVFAIIIRKELLIPILCGIFLVESLSVLMQVTYFKYTKRKTGKGRRIFRMAPLHHHYQKKGLTEPKIVSRFWIVAIILAVVSIITLKIR